MSDWGNAEESAEKPKGLGDWRSRERTRRTAPLGTGVQVMQLTHRHESIMNWMLVNPEKSLRECADYHGVTQGWLSSLVHTDLFQLTLKERQVSIQAKIADSIPAKLRTVADVGLEKLTTMVEDSEDPRFILDATDKILHRMGFAPASARNPAGSPGAVMAQQNNFFLTEGDLMEARALMGRGVQMLETEPFDEDVDEDA